MIEYPDNYLMFQEMFPELIQAHEQAGTLARDMGPIDVKTGHLIQLAACVALRSEGGAHSHARRAISAGASSEEIYHTIKINNADLFHWNLMPFAILLIYTHSLLKFPETLFKMHP